MRPEALDLEAGTHALLRNVHLAQAPHVLARPARGPAILTLPVAASTLQGPGEGTTSMVDGMNGPQAALEEARLRGLAEGRRQGFEEGLRQGLRDAATQVESARMQAMTDARTEADVAAAEQAERWGERGRRLDHVLAGFERAASEHLQALEGDAIELAFEVVCRLLGEPSLRKTVVESMVRRGFAGLRSQALRIRIHPADLGLLDECADLRAAHPGVEWVGDQSVEAGGCLLDSRKGTLDARLDVQLRQLLKAWQGSGLLAEPGK